MRLIGLLRCRNDDYILELTARVALSYCDSILVHLHCCTDSSADIVWKLAREFPGRVHFEENDNPKWDEMRHMQSLLEFGRARGMTHGALIDADEIASPELARRARSIAESLRPAEIALASMVNLRG